MIGYIKGNILTHDDKSVILNTNNVGYEVFTPLSTLMRIKDGEELELLIHTHVREDQITLFGFELIEEKELFRHLISVSGVGPKSALTMLSISTHSQLIKAIQSGKSDNFPKISGVGKKTLEKIILDLQNKFDHITLEDDSDDIKSARMALETLGYNNKDIAEALESVDVTLNMNEIIKLALRNLSKK
jgi:Holliday junction DNA helicase RuvA